MVQNKVEENKFCFIICSNDSFYLQECMFYIGQLNIPKGYEIEVLSIQKSQGMAAGYNEGMNASNAKYKVYLHHDVFILNRNFLYDILTIFNQDETIGMIGMVGPVKMPTNGMMWYTDREGDIFLKRIHSEKELDSYYYKIEDGYCVVEAIDGLMMITSKDLPWREELFDGYHYYDVSQSLEFLRKGYKVVVPNQKVPWVYHDSPIMNLRTYDKYRKIGMEEYREIFYPDPFTVCNRVNNLSLKENVLVLVIATNQYYEVQETLQSLSFCKEIEKDQILIVDNGSTDELRHWLIQQKEYSYIRCNEILEGYGRIMQKVTEEFITSEDLLVLSPGMKLAREAVSILQEAMIRCENCGAVTAKVEKSQPLQISLNESKNRERINDCKKIIQVSYFACLISNQFLKGIDVQSYDTPEFFFKDLSIQGILKDIYYYELDKALFFCNNLKEVMKQSHYKTRFEYKHDESLWNERWNLVYFGGSPNTQLLELMDKPKDEEIYVLEIGCDCGKNLMEVKNRYPKAKVYGLEINPQAVKIASKFAKVETGNIEEKSLSFGNIKFDYILFGDVLEHLKDPEGTLVYCKNFLKKDGKFVLCIPNLNHYSVMKQLVNGYFTYKDQGILDRSHIHFFTYYEIMAMIQRIGCKAERVTYFASESTASPKEKEFVQKLIEISEGAEPFMYFAYQYILSVSKGE